MQKINSKIINVKRPENRAHKCDYSCKPSRLLESPISAIRINPHDYSPWPTTHKKALDASRTEG